MVDTSGIGDDVYGAVLKDAAANGYSTKSAAIQGYATTAGTVAGAAVCAAFGAGAAAPICSAVGGAVGGFIAGIGVKIFGGGPTDSTPGIMQESFIKAVRAAQNAVGETVVAGGNLAANDEIAAYANAAAKRRRAAFVIANRATTSGQNWYAGIDWWGKNGFRSSAYDRVQSIRDIGPGHDMVGKWDITQARMSDLIQAVVQYVSARSAEARDVQTRSKDALTGPGTLGSPGTKKSSGFVGWFVVGLVLLVGGAAAWEYHAKAKK